MVVIKVTYPVVVVQNVESFSGCLHGVQLGHVIIAAVNRLLSVRIGDRLRVLFTIKQDRCCLKFYGLYGRIEPLQFRLCAL